MHNDLLKPGERLDDLQHNGLAIIQNPALYRFTSDAVELANFADASAGEQAVDLGAGTGILSLLLAGKRRARVTAVELQETLCDMLDRSVTHNRLHDLIQVMHLRLQELPSHVAPGSASLVICNPPYRRAGTGKMHEQPSLRLARHETAVTFAEIATAAAYLLPSGGRFYLSHIPERLDEILCTLREHRLTPKHLQFLLPAPDKPPHIFLLKCIKDARPGMTVPPMRTIDCTM